LILNIYLFLEIGGVLSDGHLSEEFKILVDLLVLLQDFFFEVSLFLLKLVSLFFLLESLEFCLVLNVHLYNNFLLALLSFLLVGVLVS
tara:strand:- start:770 stop:1033 length:264 start_codon:yes stop_codon:yes gene_type:complete